MGKLSIMIKQSDCKHIQWGEGCTVYLMGIGGIGMGGLAEVLLSRGCQVRGSDLVANKVVQHLRTLGADIALGHDDVGLEGVQALVCTSAIPLDHPMKKAADGHSIPCLSRAAMLALLVKGKSLIAVSGTHGKTTTTALTSHLLTAADLDPGYFVGGHVPTLEGLAHDGKGDWVVVEADESDASFLTLTPDITVITNVDEDHLENYSGGFEAIKETFLTFIEQLNPNGLVILCADCPGVQALLSRISVPTITYGFSPDADVRITAYKQEGLQSQIKILWEAGAEEALTVSLPGRHNALNALASLLVAKRLGVRAQAKQALATFSGVDRRLQVYGKCVVDSKGVLLLEDYGHHPVELNVTLEAVRSAWSSARLVWVFQPHRYTRTQAFLKAFSEVLAKGDVVILLPVYAASEAPIANADSQALGLAVKHLGQKACYVLDNVNALDGVLAQVLKEDDILLFQGAGDIGRCAIRLSKSCITNK